MCMVCAYDTTKNHTKEEREPKKGFFQLLEDAELGVILSLPIIDKDKTSISSKVTKMWAPDMVRCSKRLHTQHQVSNLLSLCHYSGPTESQYYCFWLKCTLKCFVVFKDLWPIRCQNWYSFWKWKATHDWQTAPCKQEWLVNRHEEGCCETCLKRMQVPKLWLLMQLKLQNTMHAWQWPEHHLQAL